MINLGKRFRFHFTKVMEKSHLTVSATKIPRESLMIYEILFLFFFFFPEIMGEKKLKHINVAAKFWVYFLAYAKLIPFSVPE